MKNIILLLILTTILCSCPTEAGEDKTYKYTITNNTNVVVEIIPYQNPGNGLPELTKKISIQPGGKFEKTKIDVPIYTGFSFREALYDGHLTKIDIVFGNDRKIVYDHCNTCVNPRNIFDLSYNDEFIETYTITPEDYQNATPCNGNCY
ncbi:hypothetical protein [Chryseobacterium sp.]|uniref:hypothetical protein n=1 Tax=Chryseobacterium sp. TaxID=1871047 RepID=UPI0012A95809|nr:hypothetical protein [Chryseobacterium sp.]QFG54489.1 hypothetical protein F7R58_12805 [Chryseobacterium sp.]